METTTFGLTSRLSPIRQLLLNCCSVGDEPHSQADPNIVKALEAYKLVAAHEELRGQEATRLLLRPLWLLQEKLERSKSGALEEYGSVN